MTNVTDDECTCEFDFPEPDGEESWHYTRTCPDGHTWGALHCPHDGVQNPCPECGWLQPGTVTPLELLSGRKMPR
jgi:hypothetical protein